VPFFLAEAVQGKAAQGVQRARKRGGRHWQRRTRTRPEQGQGHFDKDLRNFNRKAASMNSQLGDEARSKC
jgi:hypothetical protein